MPSMIDDLLKKIAPPCDGGTHDGGEDSDLVSQGSIFLPPSKVLENPDNADKTNFIRFYRGEWLYSSGTFDTINIDGDFECVAIGPSSHWGNVYIRPAGEYKDYHVKAGTPLIGHFRGPVKISAFPENSSAFTAGISVPLELIFYRTMPQTLPLKRSSVVRGLVGGVSLGFDDVPTSNSANFICVDGRKHLGIFYENASGGAVDIKVNWFSFYQSLNIENLVSYALAVPTATTIRLDIDVPVGATIGFVTSSNLNLPPAMGVAGQLYIEAED